MKKWIALALALILVASLAACGQEKPQETTSPQEFEALQVGYGRSVITPEEPMVLDGSFNKDSRIWKNVLDDLYATCTAFTDGEGNTILLYHMDLLVCSTWTVYCRKEVSDQTGVPFDNVMVACTHTHSGPDVRSGYETEARYTELLKARMTEAAKAALADRKPAEMYTSSIQLKNMNFVRHYYMDDGSVVGDNFGNTEGKTYVGHVSEADNTMQLVCFKRQGGNDVVLVNWQAHPHRSGGQTKTVVSSDIVGVMRSYMENEIGCSFAYFTGASGNLNETSRISSENITTTMQQQGDEMGRYAVLALDNLTKVKTGKVQILKEDFENVDAVGNTMAFSLGDVAFVMAPYEMFDTNGKYIKDNSPFAMTFIVTCANAHSNYIPSASVYEYDIVAYEMKGNYKKGTAENLASGYVGLLNKLYETRYLGGEVKPITQATAGNDLYWNLDKGTDRKAGSDGAYAVDFLKLGQKVTLKVTDKAVMEKIDQLDAMGLQLEGDKVTAVFPLSETRYHRVAWNYYVQRIEGNAVKTNSYENGNSQDAAFTLSSVTQVYDLSDYAKTPGEVTTLEAKDKITAVADAEGKVLFVFVTERVARFEADSTPRYCEHCKKDVTWNKWLDARSLPKVAGHFYLTENVTLTETMRISQAEVCLDLNGKTVKQTSTGRRLLVLGKGATLNFMDSGETGTLIPASADVNDADRYGMGIAVDGDQALLNYYSGTVDATDCSAMYGACVLVGNGTANLYGGTLKGGTVWGSGGGCLTVGEKGTLFVYDILMIGGNQVAHESYNSGVSNGGAVFRVTGKATVYGGTFQGGSTVHNGGCLYVRNDGDLTMLGGTVLGGNAEGLCGGLYVDGKLTLGKNVTITDNENGNIYLAAGSKFQIHEDGLENTQVGIAATQGGEFAKGTFTQEDAAHFVSDDPQKTVTVTDQGLALEKIQ